MLAPHTSVIANAAKYDPEPFRQTIVDRGGEKFAAGLVEALEPSVPCGLCKRPRYQVWAYRTFAKVAKLTNTEPQVLVAILQQYGVQNEDEMRSLVDAGRRLQTLTADATSSLEAFRDESLGVLEDCLRLHPEWRGEVLARLGGKAILEAGETNGQAHP